jgi:uncharacterized phiE125 gp8 family phage protein
VYSLALVTAPVGEPITLAEAKQHLRLAEGVTQDNEYIESLIAAARQFVEFYTDRQLLTATYDLTLDGFPPANEAIFIPRAPLQSVTSVTYLEAAAGTSTVMTAGDYRVQITEPGRISLDYDVDWPDVYGVSGQVVVRFVAGYGAAAAVPLGLRHAVKMMLKHYYFQDDKEKEAAKNLMQAFRYGVTFWSYGR